MKTDGLAQRRRVQVGPGRPEATHPTPERGLGCHQDGDQPAPPSSPPFDRGQHLYVISWVLPPLVPRMVLLGCPAASQHRCNMEGTPTHQAEVAIHSSLTWLTLLPEPSGCQRNNPFCRGTHTRWLCPQRAWNLDPKGCNAILGGAEEHHCPTRPAPAAPRRTGKESLAVLLAIISLHETHPEHRGELEREACPQRCDYPGGRAHVSVAEKELQVSASPAGWQ
ncbi:uncharacterized protein ACBT57_007482 [Dama dama]